jgi:hypothetical protein
VSDDKVKELHETGEGLREVNQELPKLLDTVAEKIPNLIRGLTQTVFSEQAGRDFGKGVAAFYTSLKESGMPDELVHELMREYVNTLRNATNVMSGVNLGNHEHKKNAE